MKKISLLLLIPVILITYVAFNNSFELTSYFMAASNKVKMQEVYWGPYYRIISGINSEKKDVFLVFIKGHEEIYRFNKDEGISEEKAIDIAIKNGYKIYEEKVFMQLSALGRKHLNNSEKVRENLVWTLYFDYSNGLFVEVNFLTGEIKEY